MREYEVLAARLPDHAREAAIAREIGADATPSERKTSVEPVKWMPARCGLASTPRDVLGIAVDEVDHAVGEARLPQHVHHERCTERRRRRRLPDDDVAEHCRRGAEVAADGREVERRDGIDEALERPVLHAVPGLVGRGRLLGEHAVHALDVEAQEVGELARGVHLGLVDRLRLVEHRRPPSRRSR